MQHVAHPQVIACLSAKVTVITVITVITVMLLPYYSGLSVYSVKVHTGCNVSMTLTVSAVL